MKRQPGSRFLVSGMFLAALVTATPPASPFDVPGPRGLAPIQVPFVENCGQWDSRVAFAADTGFGTVFVTREGQLVYSLGDGASLVETPISGKPVPRPGQAAATRVNDFRGADSSRWQRALPSYDTVGLGEVWRGVSVSLAARGGNVEKLFTVAPGANVRGIGLRLDGASSLRIDGEGGLVARTARGDLRFSPPVAYQDADGSRSPVAAAYTLHGARYGFRLGNYDRSRPVIVDPLLQSTYLGGNYWDQPHLIAVQPSSGDVVVAGGTGSSDFPGTAGGAQPAHGGWWTSSDGFVARLDPTLTTLLQATYLGGISDESIRGMAIDPTSGEVVVAGSTYSSNFPGTAGGAQPLIAGQADGFVARLDPTLGTLLQSTYLGGTNNDAPLGVSILPSGEVVVAGYTGSADFPKTAGGAQPAAAGEEDGFVARLDANLSTLVQATYLGGGSDDLLDGGVAIHPTSGEIFVTGSTQSTDFPGAAGGAQPSHGGGAFDDFDGFDGFITRLDPTLTILLQTTYLGGSGDDFVHGIAIPASSADVFVTGHTSSIDFPGTAGGAQPTRGGGVEDGFVARLNSSLTMLVQSSYLGGNVNDRAYAIAGHPASGEVLVAGYTDATNFPGTEGGAQPANRGDREAFVARLDDTLHNLLRATYIGGSGYDDAAAIAVNVPPDGDVLVIGQTDSADLSGTAGGAQPSIVAYRDGFATRLTADLTAVLSPFGMLVDTQADPGDGDSVFEAGEEVRVLPLWQNLSDSSLAPHGQASEFTGKPGATYTILSDTAAYQTIPPGGVGFPPSSSYVFSVSASTARPLHWDARFTETLDVPRVLAYRRSLHIGESFPDVPRTNRYYRDVETVLHHGIASGCSPFGYCPDAPVTRAQMAFFLLTSKHGKAYVPPPCTGVFSDVSCPNGFSQWIEQLYREGITAGCGGDKYCPTDPVTRDQMAAFLLKTMHGSDYVPASCTGHFGDVQCPSLFADWIENLAADGITVGCSGGNYCPDRPNTRGQMAVFLVKSFGLTLYGP